MNFSLSSLRSLFSSDLAIDLGTANTIVYVTDRGIVLNEPSVIAIKLKNRFSNRVLAIGTEARKMLGRTPNGIRVVRPMRDGVIADFEITSIMLRQFIRRIDRRWAFRKPIIVIAVPSGITQVEKRAVIESAETAGARKVFLIEEPMAAAIGADLPVTEPTCNMVIDIGGGTTDVAVISLGGIVYSKSIKVAGDKMNTAIIQYIRRKYNLLLGERTAESIKMTLGNVCPSLKNPETMAIKGRNLKTGIPATLLITEENIRQAISEQIDLILQAVKTVLEQTPPELLTDIFERGVLLTGGGALLKNLDKYISDECNIPVIIPNHPLTTVALGTGKVLGNIKRYQHALL